MGARRPFNSDAPCGRYVSASRSVHAVKKSNERGRAKGALVLNDYVTGQTHAGKKLHAVRRDGKEPHETLCGHAADLRSPQLDWDGVTFDVCGLCQQRVAKSREAGQGSF